MSNTGDKGFRRAALIVTALALMLLSGCIIYYSDDPHISGQVIINGTASADNISSYSLYYKKEGSSTWNNAGISIPAEDASVNYSELATWDSSYVMDGSYTLMLNITDEHGQESKDFVYLNIENLEIRNIENNTAIPVQDTIFFNGTATGTQYSNYTLRYRNSSDMSWTTQGITLVDNGYPNKTNETLATIATASLMMDNQYVFELSMPNDNGFTNRVVLNISFMEEDIYEDDDTVDQATEIATNGSGQSHNFLPEYDIDWVDFSAAADKQYIIYTTSPNKTSMYNDAVMYIYDSSLSLIDLDDDTSYPSDLNPKMRFFPESSGTYHLKIINYYGFAGGRYNLFVEEHDKHYKGIIPEIADDSSPFYTDENTKECGILQAGDYCNASFRIAPYVADAGESFDFLTIVNMSGNITYSNTTRVEVEEPDAPTITLRYPSNGSDLVSTTSSVTLKLKTDELAYCRLSTSSRYSYYYDGISMTTSDYSTHKYTIETQANKAYDYYYICRPTLYSVYTRTTHHHFTTNGTASDDDDDDDDSSSSSSSSSSSGATPGGSYPTGLTIRRLFLNVFKDKPAQLEISNNKIAVKELSIRLREDHKNVRIEVKVIDDEPSERKSSKVYQYLEISVANVVQGTIEEGVINFSVEKSWLGENNASADDIVLSKYFDDEGWKDLETNMMGQTSDEIRYTAKTDEFSLFAINIKEKETVLEPGAPEPVNITANESNATDGTATKITADAVAGSDMDPGRDSIGWSYVIVALCILALGGLGYYSYTKRDAINEFFATIKDRSNEEGKAVEIDEALKEKEKVESELKVHAADSGDALHAVAKEIKEKGLDKIMVEAALIGRYSPESIEHALSEVERIYSFIMSQQQKGYDADAIKKSLISKGWDARLIDILLKN